MKQIFVKEIQRAIDARDSAIAFNYLMAIERSILHYAAVSAIEYFASNLTDEAVELKELLLRIHTPNDSAPVDILDALIPPIRQSGWDAFAHGWYEDPKAKEQAQEHEPLVSLLRRWVELRNDRPGHGVVDQSTIERETPRLIKIARQSVFVLQEALPGIKTNANASELVLQTPGGEQNIISLRVIDGHALVIRKLINRRGSWSLKYQTLDIEESKEAEYPLDTDSPLLAKDSEFKRKYIQVKVPVKGKDWRPFVLLPNRQTGTFEGRDEQLTDLREWYDDLDSRACLIYGDGGIGKTTLVLEFIHDILDSPDSELEFTPDIICFYSAKLTRWSQGGVIYLKGIAPVIEDAIRQIVVILQDTLGREWYTLDARSLISKAASILSEIGINRNNILLVLDNTETLARKPSEVKELSRLIAQITSKLARVIVTSRRREEIEARPIEIPPLDEEAGLALLRTLADEYNAKSLQQAGDARLRRVTRDLVGKPLLIVALARYVAHTASSIDAAYKRVMSDAREGLSEFLYDDAWRRISQQQREVLLVLGSMAMPINHLVAGWVCSEIKIPHTVWLSAFSETYFGQLTEYGTDYDIEFNPMAIEYFSIKYKTGGPELQGRIDKIIKATMTKYKMFIEAERTCVIDRVMDAFRTGAARAAKLAAKRGLTDEAYEWYLEAIAVDTENPYLFDRFAWFLMMQKRDYLEARKYAEKSMRLDSKNPDAHFTAGLIAYRDKRLNEGDTHMAEATKLGKSKSFCLLQKGKARVEYAKRSGNVQEVRSVLDQAETFVKNSQRQLHASDPYYQKVMNNCKILLKSINHMKMQYGLLKREGYVSD